MDKALRSDAQSIWKMLDNMALSDPKGYKKIISEQMNAGKVLCSRPYCRVVQKCTLMVRLWRYLNHTQTGQNCFINLCEWELVEPPKSVTEPVPMLCGEVYFVDNGSSKLNISITMLS